MVQQRIRCSAPAAVDWRLARKSLSGGSFDEVRQLAHTRTGFTEWMALSNEVEGQLAVLHSYLSALEEALKPPELDEETASLQAATVKPVAGPLSKDCAPGRTSACQPLSSCSTQAAQDAAKDGAADQPAAASWPVVEATSSRIAEHESLAHQAAAPDYNEAAPAERQPKPESSSSLPEAAQRSDEAAQPLMSAHTQPAASNKAGADRVARQALASLKLLIPGKSPCQSSTALLLIYEAILDEQDRSKHEPSERLTDLRTRFWQLRKAIALEEQCVSAKQLLEALQSAADDDGTSRPEAIAAMRTQLQAAQGDVEDMASTAAMVLSEGACVSVLEGFALQEGHSCIRNISSQPAAMREGKWLVSVNGDDLGKATAGAQGRPSLMDAATALQDLYKQTDPQFWEHKRFSMHVTSPQPWHDPYHLPGHVNLEQERLGAARRLWPISNQLHLSRRSQLMDLQVSIS